MKIKVTFTTCLVDDDNDNTRESFHKRVEITETANLVKETPKQIIIEYDSGMRRKIDKRYITNIEVISND